MILYFLIFFLLQANSHLESGMIIIENSLHYFVSEKTSSKLLIKKFNENQTPVHQYIQVNYVLNDKKQIISLSLSSAFKKIFDSSHQQMQRAESLMAKRLFNQAVLVLDSIKKIYPNFPYLITSYIYIYQQEKNLNKISELDKSLKNYEKYMTRQENAFAYFLLYQAWRDLSEPEKKEAFKKFALNNLEKSNNLDPDPEKLRILNQLKNQK
jgi:tetratricopeptide (TPR) repeat protein